MVLQVTTRSYAGEPDLVKISELLDACEIIDQMGLQRSPAELRVDFEDPAVDQARDICLWEDAEGSLLGYALLEIKRDEKTEGTLRYRVHPAARADDLDAGVIQWAEERMREVAAQQSGPVQLVSWARDDDKARCFTLEWHWFTPVRYFFQLSAPLTGPIPPPEIPAGFTLRAADPERDAGAWVEMFNETFIDHWNYHPLTLEAYWHQRRADPGYTPKHDLVVVAPDGTFAAFCWSIVNWDEIRRSGNKQALLHQIGTRRGFRDIGLARAILLAAMGALKEDGLESVRLYVDADNPTGATRLYDSVGFEKVFTLVHFAKEISA